MTCLRCVTPSTCSWNGCSPGTSPTEWPINKERRLAGEPMITQAEHVAGGVALLKSATELIDAIGRHNAGMPQTTAERQEALRARRLMEGKTEVRGIYLHPDQHAELKAFAKKIAKRREADARKNPANSPQNPANTEGG